MAISARVSTSEQNPEAQLLALREYAARRGFVIYKEYVDHVSGDVERRRAKRQNDHAYRELMEDASRNFDCDLVWKYDRFARSVSILVAVLQQLSTLGIYFISYTQCIDTTTAIVPCQEREYLAFAAGKDSPAEAPLTLKRVDRQQSRDAASRGPEFRVGL